MSKKQFHKYSPNQWKPATSRISSGQGSLVSLICGGLTREVKLHSSFLKHETRIMEQETKHETTKKEKRNIEGDITRPLARGPANYTFVHFDPLLDSIPAEMDYAQMIHGFRIDVEMFFLLHSHRHRSATEPRDLGFRIAVSCFAPTIHFTLSDTSMMFHDPIVVSISA